MCGCSTELQERNQALTEALERQTATSAILRVISQSPTDVQPVFDTIIQNAVGLCGAARGTVYRFDGELIHVAAQAGYSEEQEALFLSVFPCPPGIEAPPGRAILERAVVHIPTLDGAGPALASMQRFQQGSTLAVPLLKDGNPVGALGLSRIEFRAYSDAEIELIKTFADQAVIAIENVRLFKALQATQPDLTDGAGSTDGHQRLLQIIAASPTEVQPVLDAIADERRTPL